MPSGKMGIVLVVLVDPAEPERGVSCDSHNMSKNACC